jgi:propanol-preferring alcohol dehydrogenase
MKAMLLAAPAPASTKPLALSDVPVPEPEERQILVRVAACGICRTDLHVVEGDLPPQNLPLIPGHQIVGVVERTGPRASRYRVGDRVGIGWLHGTCGICRVCASRRENLCESATFTGYTAQGGYAEFATAEEDFAYSIPEEFTDLEAAPLLCAGIIGFRCLRLSGVRRGSRLGLYGFGAAAHVAIQVARHWGCEVFVCTRGNRHQELARELGAVWAGGAVETPPKALDAAIIFAPAGELVLAALAAVGRGGAVILGGIHMSDIPSFPYRLIYGERQIRSVMNNTREDGLDFLRVAAGIPIRTRTRVFPLEEANSALGMLKGDEIQGAAVLRITSGAC